ncbi:universal stress protein [Salinilacihabitans rarus]|uniref:universal stress protein n=1 Tax=Salinilacihabitans rarus TaxID=2961596 RepID=UPI0020C86C0E|nr:universal stress protein [Salinilacihabitans rarus]
MATRILVAFDESSQSTAALRHALSTYPDAEVLVLHVNDPREWSTGDGMDGFYYSEEAFERSKESAERLLAEAEALAGEYDVEVETVAEIGRTAPTIIRCAEERDVDHVVLGSHGRRGLARFLLGSVAERVARRSPGSVTIVREEEPADG